MLSKMGEKIKTSQDAVPKEEPKNEREGLREKIGRWKKEKSLSKKELKKTGEEIKESIKEKIVPKKASEWAKKKKEKWETERKIYTDSKIEEAKTMLQEEKLKPKNILLRVKGQWRPVATALSFEEAKKAKEELKRNGAVEKDIYVTTEDPLKAARKLSRKETIQNLKWGEHVKAGTKIDTSEVQKAAKFFGEGPAGKPRMAVRAWGSQRMPVPESGPRKPWMREVPRYQEPVVGAASGEMEPSPSQMEIAEMQRQQMLQQEAQGGGFGYQEESRFGKGVIPYRPVGGGGPGGTVFVTAEPVKSIYQKRIAMGQEYQYPVSGPMQSPTGRYVPFEPAWVNVL
jgi:hypothetical protein